MKAPKLDDADREQLTIACKILLLARKLNEHQCQGGVSQDHIVEWLDLAASESNNPRQAQALILRLVPDFEPSSFLRSAIQEFEYELKATA